jgi:hypothetical protein
MDRWYTQTTHNKSLYSSSLHFASVSKLVTSTINEYKNHSFNVLLKVGYVRSHPTASLRNDFLRTWVFWDLMLRFLVNGSNILKDHASPSDMVSCPRGMKTSTTPLQ